MLTAAGVSGGYGRVTVLHDVTLSVGPGEVVALLGANGAGKSTLLRVIAGELRPSAGSVDFAGTELIGLRPEQVVGAGVSLVPEGRRMFAGLTVRENLLLGGYCRRRSRGSGGDRGVLTHSRRKADLGPDIDRVFGLFPRLAQRADQAAGRLSGGEQQMAAIGRALMARPRLLMIDELSQGLAPTVVDDLIDLLPALAREGTAVLLVEQDVERALDISGRAYLLVEGRVVAAGTSAELRSSEVVRRRVLGL
ncbi:MAG TPA: ABC transporter ATP-binding protein [Acidimicrobiia bacterium]|nr:ABC transporter ATP-binding protein [Acidimicrobiia bacterium]